MKIERPSNWPSIREHVLRRDNYTCTFCGIKNVSFDVDHILALSNGGNNDYSNLRTLCRDCHAFKTRQESSRGYRLPVVSSQGEASKIQIDLIREDIIENMKKENEWWDEEDNQWGGRNIEANDRLFDERMNYLYLVKKEKELRYGELKFEKAYEEAEAKK